jgi:hypothetical protein
MYLHLGQNTVVTTQEIVGIFDMDNTTVSKTTRDTLSRAEKEGRVRYVSYDLPKSFILTADKTVYISPVAAATLIGRTEKKQSF